MDSHLGAVGSVRGLRGAS